MKTGSLLATSQVKSRIKGWTEEDAHLLDVGNMQRNGVLRRITVFVDRSCDIGIIIINKFREASHESRDYTLI